ncbi:MAG: thymidine kinase [bacterium]|nr:thymidine kinase [bacterium]
MHRGKLRLIIGNMFANKTGFLIHEIETLREFGRKRILVVKPDVDTRSPKGMLRNFHGKQMPALEVPAADPKAVFKRIRDEEQKAGEAYHVIVIDEVQFFPAGFDIVDDLLAHGYDVIAAGLRLNFRGKPFGCTLSLVGLCSGINDIIILNSRCAQCGAEASIPQRIIDGEPAPFDSPEILVGGKDSYEPRCYACFKLPGKPAMI